MGIIVSYGDFDAAVTRDAEAPEFAWWFTCVPELFLPIEVYKASHHGSENGDTLESMTTFKPQAVAISAGLDNSYGHPSQHALDLYAGLGGAIYRTDLQGTIVVTGQAAGTVAVNAAAAASEAPTLPPAAPESPAGDVTFDPLGLNRYCSDFSSRTDAQAFSGAAEPGDPHGLDSNRTGQRVNPCLSALLLLRGGWFKSVNQRHLWSSRIVQVAAK